jgi:hypothetical protein
MKALAKTMKNVKGFKMIVDAYTEELSKFF